MSVPTAALAALRARIGAPRVLTAPEDLIVHGYDGTWLERRPDVVVVAASTADVAETVRIARQFGVPIVPRGGGSGLAGGSVPRDGGVVLSTNRMNRILHVNPIGLTAVVEAGVVNAQLQAEVERRGRFYPPDPASLNQSTIGGNAATSAGGPRCLKYGGTKDYVVGLEVVLPNGDVVRLGGRSHQPGDDQSLLRAFIGSEGTLGIITEVTVRLIPLPPARGTAMATFGALEDAGRAVGSILGSGVIPLALEMMDQVTLRCVEDFLRVGLSVDQEAMLLVDVDGAPADIPEQLTAVARACHDAGATRVRVAESPAEAQQLWRARRSTSSSFGRIRPNKLGEDISVPRSEIPSMVRAVQEVSRAYRLTIPLFGHIGDGNLHPNILCDLRDADEMARVAAAARAIFEAAVRHDGVLSGEHGIGLLKRDFLPAALDPAALDLMRRMKQALDPACILNAGKVIPRQIIDGP